MFYVYIYTIFSTKDITFVTLRTYPRPSFVTDIMMSSYRHCNIMLGVWDPMYQQHLLQLYVIL